MKKVVGEALKKIENNIDKTGKQIMEKLNITFDDLDYVCTEIREEVYDNMRLRASTKYAKKLREMFDFNDEVYWYIKGKKEPKYTVTSMDRIYKSCDEFYGLFLKKSDYSHYSISIKNVIDMIFEISEEEPITIDIDFLYSGLVSIIIKEKKIIEVKHHYSRICFDDDFNNLLCLNQLIILSYDVPLIETLKLMNFC